MRESRSKRRKAKGVSTTTMTGAGIAVSEGSPQLSKPRARKGPTTVSHSMTILTPLLPPVASMGVGLAIPPNY